MRIRSLVLIAWLAALVPGHRAVSAPRTEPVGSAFDHAVHWGAALSCTECHAPTERPAMPGPEACVACHDDDPAARFPRPSSHRDDERPFAHHLVPRLDQRDCAVCHDLTDDCVDCHLREDVQPADHRRRGWDRDHARWGPRADACVICHGPPARVCTECHG